MAPAIDPNPGEHIIMEEDCAEANLGNGIMTLTNQRIIFEQTEGTMATLSKKVGKLLLDIPLQSVDSIGHEGFIITKVLISAMGKTYKFSVFNSKKWAKEIKDQKDNLRI